MNTKKKTCLLSAMVLTMLLASCATPDSPAGSSDTNPNAGNTVSEQMVETTGSAPETNEPATEGATEGVTEVTTAEVGDQLPDMLLMAGDRVTRMEQFTLHVKRTNTDTNQTYIYKSFTARVALFETLDTADGHAESGVYLDIIDPDSHTVSDSHRRLGKATVCVGEDVCMLITTLASGDGTLNIQYTGFYVSDTDANGADLGGWKLMVNQSSGGFRAEGLDRASNRAKYKNEYTVFSHRLGDALGRIEKASGLAYLLSEDPAVQAHMEGKTATMELLSEFWMNSSLDDICGIYLGISDD